MTWIENFFSSIPTIWAVLGLIAVIGLSVLLLRGIIRMAIRAFFIGAFGLLVIGAIYFFL